MDLTGKLLIAMPGMADPRFEKSVIFLCAHSDEGAMGLIINRPSQDIGFSDLLDQLSIPLTTDAALPTVHLGGPVEHGRGFVLHSGEYAANPATLKVEGGLAMTATLDVLEDIARGEGPAQALLALGYSGWGAGQIEGELRANAWLVGEAPQTLIFSDDSAGKWSAALAEMGVDPMVLSASGGRA